MTAAQLARLAEQAAFASDFYAKDNPSAARAFAQTAITADRLSVELAQAEERAHIAAGLAEVRADLEARHLAI
ncbi:MAG: hypothetical protein M3Y91_07655 [Actinomycetota bacterium]|nr:hypothetical protein [Actinomycetota bacterium]